MSQRAVFGWLIAAIFVAGVAAAVLFRRNAPSTGPLATGPALQTSYADVRSITIVSGGITSELIRSDLGWMLSRDGVRWPVEESHVRAALRLLTEGLSRSDAQAPASTDLEIRLMLSSGDGPSIRFGHIGAGGFVPATVTAPGSEPFFVRANAAVRELFEARALRVWRAPRALPDAVLGPARLRISSGESAVSLARIGKRWSFREPSDFSAIPADPEAVQQLSAAVASAAVSAFEDEMDEAALGSIRARVEVERDVPRAEGTSETIVSELIVGGLADPQGQEVLAIASAHRLVPGQDRVLLWGPQVLRLPTADLNRIAPAPLAYVSRRSLEFTSTDIRSITPSGTDRASVAFRRSLNGWEHGGSPVDPDAAGHLDRLCSLLTESRAAQIFDALPSGISPIASLMIESLGAPQPALVDLSFIPVAPGRPRPTVVIATGRFWRTYTFEGADTLGAWLSSLP